MKRTTLHWAASCYWPSYERQSCGSQLDVSCDWKCFWSHNRYKDGQDHMGEHRDDEKELDPLCPIASVSLGAARDFIFRHRDARGKQSCRQIEPVKLELAHGSLLLMNPPTNTFWYHSLPVRKKVLLPRINLTFRRITATNKKWEVATTKHGLSTLSGIPQAHGQVFPILMCFLMQQLDLSDWRAAVGEIR